jgi:hypothetical protein
VYHVYWFASYPTTIGESHTYSVTAGAANADPVTTSENFFENPDDNTVKTRATNSTGNSGIVEVTSNVRVGVSFAMTTTYDLGTNPQTATVLIACYRPKPTFSASIAVASEQLRF